MRWTSPACSSTTRFRYTLLCARPRPPGDSRISGIVSGRSAADKAPTIALRLAVTRWLARRSRVETVSCNPWERTAVLPAMRAVYGREGRVLAGERYVPVVDATERFTELVRRPPGEVPLDEGALLIAAHAHPALDIGGVLAELDGLAENVPSASAADVAGALFGEGGFAGNTLDYGDPRNSYLDDVLARRLGIPISLSVLMIEVGRRCGVPIYGVGMPGHFLVQAAGEPDVWFDPFHGGRQLDEAGCQELYEQLQTEPRFTPALLRAVDTRSILSRMLANLQQTFMRRELAGLLGGVGRFLEAATELDAVAEDLEGDDAERVQRDAAALRSRAN